MGNDHEVTPTPKGQAIGPHGLGAFYGKRTEAVLKSPQRSILGNHLDYRGGNSFGDRTTDGGPAAARASAIRTQTEYPDDHGRRHRVVQRERLQSWRHGLPHSQHRPHRQRRSAVHRLVRRTKLHGGTSRFRHRTITDPYGPDKGWPARCGHRFAGRRPECRRNSQASWLCHRSVRQEPSRRQRRVSANGARL